ncbi:hypothetical protein JCM10213_003062 [Rhodosporidiobolus nylandii]
MSSPATGPVAAVERPVDRPSSLPRPSLPSLASWSAGGVFALTQGPAPNPPTSAASVSSVETEEAITPSDGPTFPVPPPTLKMSSSKPAAPGDMKQDRTKLASFRVADIPPFRGGKEGGGGAPAPSSQPPSSHGQYRALPTGIPRPFSPQQHAESSSRRASVATVFSLPRPNAPSSSSTAGQPAGQPVATGLGINGVGVGHGGAKETLVIERLGEQSGQGRRGSLKRVLISEDEEERDSLRASTDSREGERSRMEHDSGLPLPLQRPPSAQGPSSLASSTSAVRRADSSSPPAAHGGRDSPTNKRPRTRLSPLESLAATASNLLAAPSSFSSSTAPPAPHLASFVIGAPVPASSSQQAAEFQRMKEQQQRELERRRDAASGGPPPDRLGAALGKLRATAAAQAQQHQDGEAATGGRREHGESAGGLGKRRGHRPPAVNTASSSSSSSAAALARQHPYHIPGHASHPDTLPPPRSAPVEIPSVLVGSPLDPSFAQRAARDLPPLRSTPSHAGPVRRTSRSAAADRANADREREQQAAAAAQPPLVSSSTYYIRPNQPLGPGVPFPAGATTPTTVAGGGRDSGREGKAFAPPMTHRLPSVGQPRPSPPHPTYHPLQPAPHPLHSSHSHSQSHPHSYSHQQQHQHQPPHSAHPHSAHHSQYTQQQQHQQQHGPPSPLPPMLGGRPSPSLAPAHPPPPPHSSHPSHAPPLSASASGSSTGATPTSKQAFLSLFSTFYDSLSDSRVLASSLDSQIARASSLLQTLQNAEGVLERLVDERLSRFERRTDERWRAIEGRLGALEAVALAGAGESEGPQRRGSGESNETAITSASVVEDRLDRLEKAFAVSAPGSRPGTADGAAGVAQHMARGEEEMRED